VSVRKVVVTEFLTLDGVMEAPGGEFHPEGKGGLTFRFFDEEAGKLKLEELNAASALLLGRITYEHFAAAWPGMTDEQGFAERMNSLPKFVASSTLKEPLDWNATLIGGDIAEVVSRLKKQPGGDILVCGSATLVHTLLRQDLVDELRVMLFPVVLVQRPRSALLLAGVRDRSQAAWINACSIANPSSVMQGTNETLH
jgi:dihydrofolate reductase